MTRIEKSSQTLNDYYTPMKIKSAEKLKKTIIN
jgi:hypothetical protein